MSAAQSRGVVVKIFSPLAYVAVLLAAILTALLTARTLESIWGYDVPVFLFVGAELLVAGTILYIGARALLQLEGLRRPRIVDHLRRCALLYALFVPLSALLVALVDFGDPGGGGSLAIMLCFAAGYAILVDTVLLLFVVRRRSGRQRFRSHA
ncbi:hypothetical protein GBA63_07325 [Rubrobacter tropicus]|uniref:DUF2975 domain-containing protein n=1 Tax=Rubrobacter tropicus TaxID=2653851 RepID=A0A6G8Q831_9ACTN|nr:hypothetical protein [Rubrobacter tropicus]QIN82477.1 hypothetical protein GBA63_07325 [Rubrobacter tropicus]